MNSVGLIGTLYWPKLDQIKSETTLPRTRIALLDQPHNPAGPLACAQEWSARGSKKPIEGRYEIDSVPSLWGFSWFPSIRHGPEHRFVR